MDEKKSVFSVLNAVNVNDTDADARHAVESKQAAQQRAWYEANREKVEEYNRRYYQKRKKAKNDASRNSQQI